MNIEDRFAQSEILFNNKFKDLKNIGEDKKDNSDGVSFGDVLKKSIEDTNSKMTEADTSASKFIKGEDVSIDDVMIKNQEASLSLQFLTQTRDRLLDGYNQLSKLQL